jgi:hypothetical protein
MTLAADELPVQPQERGDNESPSGISATLEILVALAALPGGARYGTAAASILRHQATTVARRPSAWPVFLTTVNTPQGEIIVRAANQAPSTTTAKSSTNLLTSADQVEVHTRADQLNSRIYVTLRVKDGFHTNCNPASLDDLIPTRVSFTDIQPTAITYAKAQNFKLSFSRTALDVYEGEATIIITFKAGALANKREFPATIVAQACNDTVC